MNRTRTGLVAVLLTASVGLTACGGGGDDEKASSASTASASASASTGTGATDASYTKLTKDNWASVLADSSKASPNSHLTMKMGSLLTATGDVSYSGAKPAMQMTMKITVSGRTINMEERLVDGVMYMSAPGMLPDGKWMKIDANTPGMGEMAGMLKNLDPSSMASLSKDAITSFKYVGEAKVDGDAVHHYTLQVDTTKAIDKLGLGSLTSQAGSMPKSITEDVFLNDDNTLRQITADVSGQKLVVDRSDASSPVKVSAPPAGDIVDMSSMMSSLGSGSAG